MMSLFRRKPQPLKSVTVHPSGARTVNLKMLLESPKAREQLRQVAEMMRRLSK